MPQRILDAGMNGPVTRLAVRWALVIGLAGGLCGEPAAGDSGVAELVGRVQVTSYRDYLRNDLYTHNGDYRSCQGAQHDPAMRKIKADFEGFGLATSLGLPFSCRGRLNYNVVGVHPGGSCPRRSTSSGPITTRPPAAGGWTTPAVWRAFWRPPASVAVRLRGHDRLCRVRSRRGRVQGQ